MDTSEIIKMARLYPSRSPIKLLLLEAADEIERLKSELEESKKEGIEK